MPDIKEMSDEESSSGNPGLRPLSIIRTIWKRKVLIACVWVPLALCAVAIVRKLPAVYVAEATILVDSQKIPEKFVSATVASDLDERIEAIRQQLLSTGELKKIIDEFGLYQRERSNHFEEEILEMMRKDITITPEPVSGGGNAKRTGAFRIGYQGQNPVLVTRVANRLTDLYVEQNLKTREGQAEGTSDFLDTQLREAKKRLDELEAAVSSYKVQHNGELPQQETSLASTLSRLQTELESNRDAINRAQQTRVILDSNLNATEASLAAQIRALEPVRRATAPVDPDRPGDPAAVAARPRSEVLQQQLDLLRARYSDNHPDVIRLRADLENVKRAEEEEQKADTAAKVSKPAGSTPREEPVPPARETPELARTREQMAGLTAQIKVTEKELDDRKAEQQRIMQDINVYQARIERLPVREQEMAQITRDYEMSKENYKSLLDKKTAAEMALDMERRQQSERFTVLDRAQVPAVPVKPKRPMLYALASGGSLVLALLVGLGLELRQNVFLGEWELPEGTIVLARLPHIAIPASSTQAQSHEMSRGKRLAGAGVTALVDRL